MPDLTNVLKQFASRYRSAVLATAGVWAALCLLIAAAAVWRLRALDLSPLWRLGLPAAAALASVGAAAWWLRRRWWSERDAAGQLDRVLDLDQRLITAQEFATASPAPALYPLLLEDTAQRYTADRIRLPQPMNPLSGGLAAVLLALLLWPQAAPPSRMAQLPQPPVPPQQPGEPPPTPPPGEGQGESSSASSSGAPQSSPSSGSEERKDQPPQQAGGGSSSPQDAPSRQGQSRQQPSKPQAGGKGQEQDGGGKGQSSQQKDGSGSEQTASASGASAQSQQGSRGQGQEPQRDQSQPSQGAQANAQGGGRASGDQEALRAEIRELLKDVSGELQQLQAQLAAAQEGQQPSPGTSTDANLYGAAEPPLPAGAETQILIQLETDRGATTASRKGQGTGRPSGEVSDEGPQTQAEAAELSDQPLAESAASRQPIPPAYRSIFDRLQQPEGAPKP